MALKKVKLLKYTGNYCFSRKIPQNNQKIDENSVEKYCDINS